MKDADQPSHTYKQLSFNLNTMFYNGKDVYHKLTNNNLECLTYFLAPYVVTIYIPFFGGEKKSG